MAYLNILFCAMLSIAILFTEPKSQKTTSYQVNGQVTTFLEIPLKGVELIAKKSKTTTKTDALGYFDMTLDRSDIILIYADGFEPFRIRVTDQQTDSLQINLILKVENVNQALSKGYLSEEQYDYARKNLKNNNSKFARYSDIYDLIQGELPGVRVIRNGAPGGGAEVILNGINSMTLDLTPVFVVDGMIVEDISFIAPALIQKINVVKEASIYGSRGANGAIEIFTTQNANAGK